MSRPRGTAAGAAAAAVPAMNIVRGWPMGALAPEAAEPMRVPQAPQNAKPAWTMRPQLGHGISPAGAPGAGSAGHARGGRRHAAAGTRHRHARQRVRRKLKRHGSRHLGRVVPGDAALGLRHGAGRAELTRRRGCGHRGRAGRRRRRQHRARGLDGTVRAVICAWGSGRGRPTKLISAAETELVVVLVFFAAAVTGDQMHPRRT